MPSLIFLHPIILCSISSRLDIGEGKEVNLASCPRVDLQKQCIQYLGPVSLDLRNFISSILIVECVNVVFARDVEREGIV